MPRHLDGWHASTVSVGLIARIDHQIGSTRLASIDYQYDANGNRTSETVYNRSLAMDVSQKTYGYNARHQLICVTDSLNSNNNATWAYDAAGNQTQHISNGVITTYQYNLRQRMSAVIRDGLTIQTARYDHNGLRIEAQSTTGTKRYSYDGLSPITVHDGDNQLLMRYLYGAGQLERLFDTQKGHQYYHNDALGSPIVITDANRTAVAYYAYDAFGQYRRQENINTQNIFGFTGHEWDEETQLLYAKARYYDPDTARFLSQDPFEGNLNTPPSLHKYLYAYQNPTVFIDPDGRASVSTMIDDAAEGCNAFTCAGWALLQGVYQVSTLGFAAVHDPVRDAYDRGDVSGGEYVVKGIGGGSAAVGVTVATGRLATPFVVGASSTTGVIAAGAATGIVEGAAVDAITQGTHIWSGIQEDYDVSQTATSAVIGGVIGGAAGGAGKYLNDRINARQETRIQLDEQRVRVVAEADDAPPRSGVLAVVPDSNLLRQELDSYYDPAAKDYIYRRSPELGDSSSIGELKDSGFIPGTKGVILTGC